VGRRHVQQRQGHVAVSARARPPVPPARPRLAACIHRSRAVATRLREHLSE
jgi:hypothetical protein